ncbi:hypothetical protein [Enterobacter cloacae]|uniref:hypothetical protein n=1 Tax=Enterobacter cloacae TaxID=550 RepID=UPI002075E5A9|nr:hypothetical protein [Enterobacter cloacae]MCM7405002.1 hypothetical protein [Enterobacter cloacae]
MSVKRYEWMACDEHSCHCDVVESVEGDMVDYEDYAALEQKLAESQREFRAADATIENLQMQLNAEREAKLALVAENAGLKDAAEFATADDMWEELGGNVMRYQYQEWYADRLKSAMEIPATDAFLAEVRASELDSLAGVAETMLVKFANQGVSDIPESKGWEMILKQASQRAAQLRKGVQS